jgi:hypothetical protein
MNEDLITNPFTENINLTLIKRNQIVVKALLSLCTLYCLLDMLNWYFILKTTDTTIVGDFFYFYTLRIRPIVSLLLLLANLCSFYFMSKANELIATGIHKENAELFNDGYRYYFRANMLFLISFCVSIISVAIRIVIRY